MNVIRCLTLCALVFMPDCYATVFDAAQAGDIGTVKRFLAKSPAAIYEVDNNDDSALVLAILEGHNKLAVYLLDRGSPVNGSPGTFPPIMACVSRYTSSSTNMLEILLKRGADPNIYYAKQQWYPIIMAVNNYMPDKVKLLARYGADFGLRDWSGTTPLELAEDRLANMRDPNFHYPHGELENPRTRARLVSAWREMAVLVRALAAKNGRPDQGKRPASDSDG